MRPPRHMKWLFWNVDWETLDIEKHRDHVLSRVLERGRMADVRWAVRRYGFDGIREFFRGRWHPEVSRKTVEFWRVVLHAEEPWPEPPAFRQNSSAPWID